MRSQPARRGGTWGGRPGGLAIRLTNPQADDALSVGDLPSGISYSVSADGFTITLSGAASADDLIAKMKSAGNLDTH